MATILVMHGPNLNLLGTREPEVYGSTSLDEIDAMLIAEAATKGHEVVTIQSNAEHALVDRVQQARPEGVAFIILNPGAFTHTSVALRDALLAVEVPFIEVHLSNVHRREEFRRHSYFSDIAVGSITGLGVMSYRLALQGAMARLEER